MAAKCLNKREIIKRHIIEPASQKRAFWKKEMTLLNRLLDEFPDQCFWSKVTFGQKFESFAILLSPGWKKLVKSKHLEYNYKIPKPENYKLEKEKIGNDSGITRKKRTTKDFLSQ